MSDTQSILARIEAAQSCCLDLATGGKTSYEDYEKRRADLLSEPLLQPHLPEWLVSCRSGGQFWSLMKEISSTYQGRREFLWNEFAPLVNLLEKRGIEPTSISLDEVLEKCSSKNVAEVWSRCFQRREDDPEGAITSARTLLESVCKFILDERGESYNPKDDLLKLYKRTALFSTLAQPNTKSRFSSKFSQGADPSSVVSPLCEMHSVTLMERVSDRSSLASGMPGLQ